MKLVSDIEIDVQRINIDFVNMSMTAAIRWRVVAGDGITSPMLEQNISGVVPQYLLDDMKKCTEAWLNTRFAQKALGVG